MTTKDQDDRCPLWLTQAVLLQPEDKLDPKSPIIENPAENRGGPNFELLHSREPVVACDNPSIIGQRPPLYIPTRNECIIVAKRVISLKGDDSLRRLWLVLESRFHKSSMSGGRRLQAPICTIYPPEGWLGIGKYHGMQWERSKGSDDDDLTTVHESEVS